MIIIIIIILSMKYSAAVVFITPFVCSEWEIQRMLTLQLTYLGVENSTKMGVAKQLQT